MRLAVWLYLSDCEQTIHANLQYTLRNTREVSGARSEIFSGVLSNRVWCKIRVGLSGSLCENRLYFDIAKATRFVRQNEYNRECN